MLRKYGMYSASQKIKNCFPKIKTDTRKHILKVGTRIKSV